MNNQLDPELAEELIHRGFEAPDLDYKQSFDDSTGAWMELAKDIYVLRRLSAERRRRDFVALSGEGHEPEHVPRSPGDSGWFRAWMLTVKNRNNATLMRCEMCCETENSTRG